MAADNPSPPTSSGDDTDENGPGLGLDAAAGPGSDLDPDSGSTSEPDTDDDSGENATHQWFSDRLSDAEIESGGWTYSTVPADVEGATVHRYVPFWVVREGTPNGDTKLHLPVEGASKHEPSPLCRTALKNEKTSWSGDPIKVYPPPEFHPICDRCFPTFRDEYVDSGE